MRVIHLLLWDMRFQAKYGFYLLYAILTIIYAIVLLAVPDSWQEKTAAILIFSDPASMGLFFMGAIVLLEKNQHTPCALAVSPVHAIEYIVAKIGSLSVISLVVATILAFVSNVSNLHIVMIGTVISGTIFTLAGMIVATKISSLNQFILWTIPIEVVCYIPAILHLFKITPAWLGYYPINVCMEMISGVAPSAIDIFLVMALTIILLVLSKNSVLKMWSSMGGVKL